MIRIRKKKKIETSVIKKQIQDGKTINLFNEPMSIKEAKNLFGNNYKTELIKYTYHLFEKNANGDYFFNVKNEAQFIKLNNKPKSFRKKNLIQNIKDDIKYKTYKPIYEHLNLNGNENILIRDNEDNVKNISKNAYYDVNNIHLELSFNVSDEIIQRKPSISNAKINEIKQILNIPINSKLLPNQIFNIIEIFLKGDDDENIIGYFNTFPEIRNLNTSCFITVKNTENNKSKLLKLKKDGDTYYLYSSIRNYTNMNNIFNKISINIDIPTNKNCVIETLKYIYSHLPKGNKKIFKIELKNIEKKYIENNEIPSYNKLVDFLETTQTNYKIFNWTDKNDYNNNTFDSKKKIFNFIVYNKHLYLLENDNNYDKIKYSLDTNDKYLILDENKFNNEFNSLLKENKHPKIIKINKEKGTMNVDIETYENNKIIFIKDDIQGTNSKLLYLCQIFNISYNPFITEGNFIEKVLMENKIIQQKSFFLYNHSSRDIIYSEEINDTENFITFDFNKYYSNILLSLDKIPIINNLIHKTEKFIDGEKIDDNYVYSIEILDNNYNLWFKNDDLYFGKVLNTNYYKPIFDKMKKDNKLKIVDKIKCDWIDNYYKPIIEKLFEIVEITKNKNNIVSTIKNIINKTIGKFQLNKPEMKELFNNIHIEENNEVINYHHNENEEYFNYKIDNTNYKIFYQLETKKNYYFNVLENHRPLRTLIINLSWLNMLKFIIDNKIDDKDIYQINTDSLTIRNFKENPNSNPNDEFSNCYLERKRKKPQYKKDDEIYYIGKYNELIKKIENEQIDNKYNLYGIKIQEYKKYNDSINISPNNISFFDDIKKHNNQFVLNLGYAGSGKSYKIDKLIDKFIKNNESYILLAPLIKVLKLYNVNINKNTVQYYFKNNKIPIENNIIIDEFYLINYDDMRFIINWLYTHKKNIYLYGDIFQLPPIFSKYNKSLNNSDELNDNDIDNDIDDEKEQEYERYALNIDFLKCISTEFNYYLDTDENKRNNFNFDVYDEFIKNEYTEKEQILLINHFINNKCDITKKHINICYRNQTKNDINDKFLLKNNQEFNKNKISGINIPLISKKNYKINDIIICAKDEYYLSVNNNKYILSYENIDNKLITFEMEYDKIYKLFNVAYCLNLYNIQGQTMTNFNYILDDIYFLNKSNKYNIKGSFYTLLSRIKEPLKQKKITTEYINNIINNNIIINNDVYINKNNIYKFGKNKEKTYKKYQNNRNIIINI